MPGAGSRAAGIRRRLVPFRCGVKKSAGGGGAGLPRCQSCVLLPFTAPTASPRCKLPEAAPSASGVEAASFCS
eukprot:8451414-Alexandrium_andersonii.AAC.1